MVKKGTIATIIAVPIVALGGAGGYYAWQQHNEAQQRQERRLSKAEHALSSLRSESAKQATTDKKRHRQLANQVLTQRPAMIHR